MVFQMADYALSTSLYTYAQASLESPFFGWPLGTGEAELIQELGAGDMIVPKFAASAAWAGGEADDVAAQRSYCESLGIDYEKILSAYKADVADGLQGVPFLMKVLGPTNDEADKATQWACVPIERVELEQPLSSKELLMLRAFPTGIAAQFKGAVARGRHLQELPPGTAKAVLSAAKAKDRETFLRKYSIVEATSTESAEAILKAAGRTVDEGDRVFLAGPGGMLGVHDGQSDGHLHAVGQVIAKTPEELQELFEEAKGKARPQDQFAPSRVMAAASELRDLLDGPAEVIAVDDFARFHDRYVLLASKVTQALEIAGRSTSSDHASTLGAAEDESDQEIETEIDEIAALQGLTIEAVRQKLPESFVLPDTVLAEAVTALRAGKHLLLGGPPGTGKSTLAEALCAAVMEAQYDVVTATADWTTFDTVGGYMPADKETLVFEPGVVLRCLARNRWLVVDELNRADIDKAFGPLFTLLAGTEGKPPNERVLLPYQGSDGKNISIQWAETRALSSAEYTFTPGWRIIGTLNLSDKASLFQLSFAFLRRFAVVDVPLPPHDEFKAFFENQISGVDELEVKDLSAAALDLAFGPRQLGPAILKDIANFVSRGMVQTASGSANYSDAVVAFATAIRLYAVPQYEGADAAEVNTVVSTLRDVWPDRPKEAWTPLEEALRAVTLG